MFTPEALKNIAKEKREDEDRRKKNDFF